MRGNAPTLLYLDQNYLSGIAKRKPAFRELEPVLREAVRIGAVAVVESDVHELESAPRPDLKLIELLRELSGGRRLPAALDHEARETRRRMLWTIEREFPERRLRASDAADLDALALALAHCDLVACDAFMADVLRRTRLDLHHECELFSGRRPDVARLRDRLRALADHQRARGSLLGLAVGDALGAPLEGAPPEVARRAVAQGLEMTGGGVWAPGEWTDDTALALCLAESIAAHGLLDTDDVASRYIAWARTGKGMGSTTRAALVGATGADDTRARARAFGDSPSNGTVMRAAPIGLAARSVDEATRAAREDALLTHHAPAAGDASAALCAALVAIRRGEAPDTRFAGDPHEGMCWTTLRIALDALAAGDYESGIVSVIGLGGDTDTNAAVAGALLGCRDGPHAIPARWLAALRDRERVERAARSVASSPPPPSAARRAGPGSSG